MDLIANYLTYLPLRLSRNPIDVVVDAASESVVDRSGLSYLLEIWKPRAFQSGAYELYNTLTGSEIPPRNDNGLMILEGCRFEIHSFIDALLDWNPPTANQTAITVCPGLTMPYFLYSQINPVPSSEVFGDMEIAIKAKLHEDQFPGWKDLFFVNWIGEGKRFLTWQEDNKLVERDQPEFLYFLINMQPKPEELRLRCRIQYTDGSYETRTVKVAKDIIQNCVYCIPVGLQSLSLETWALSANKQIDSYEVWLNNENDDRISEIRTYILSDEYNRNVRYLIFQNSLGGFDTLRCYGQASTSLNVTTNLAQKTLESGYLPSSEELFVTSKNGDRTITLNTGYQKGIALDYMEELVWAEKVYLVTQEGFIPIIASSQNYQPQQDDEHLNGRSFTFRHAKEATAFSKLPLAQASSTRPTVWVPEQPYCQIDSSTGLRNGYQGAAKLRLYYQDTMQPVKSVSTKPNVPGTEGYYPPQKSPACDAGTTPFKNAEIRKAGTFVRNNCTNATGTVGEVFVLAGRFGSEISQADADKRASNEWDRINTQDWANQYGSCLAGPEFYEMSNIPANKFNARFGYISGVNCGISAGQAIITGSPDAVIYSNAWFAGYSQNPNSIIYPVGSNDIKLPCDPGTAYRLNMTTNKPIRIQVYVNGTEIFNRTYQTDENVIMINESNGPNPPTIANQGKMYIKFTPL
ncbi:DUF5977 domain-containing protein [Siphonobacter sp. SORGH_AS_0500]|uniref:DUF5977 domain-containing protein n=1 Tax=Siphonobacter sp. SORGH_AS_0500 TaxID=1864824 RepID=UPI00285912BD|nr:DUF5977 domain-containing protein [Siphonobacter sp. SORGH_AS_0500]MDR6194708.1 hypothetical protein [Siphonobacter sp. SORGH_AS_0500]